MKNWQFDRYGRCLAYILILLASYFVCFPKDFSRWRLSTHGALDSGYIFFDSVS